MFAPALERGGWWHRACFQPSACLAYILWLQEWVVLELEQTCLLAHVRIHNKSVSEWDISCALIHKNDAYQRVRHKCEAPRKEMTYNIDHRPCRFVKVYCSRGSPVAINFIQVIGIVVPNLVPELTKVAEFLTPQILDHLRCAYIHLLRPMWQL